MKLVIENADLARAVKVATRIAAPATTIPVLSSCRLAAGPDGLTIEATDMQRHVVVRAEANVETPGEILVDAGRLGALANGLPAGGQARLSLAGAMLGITSGKSRWRLGAPDEADKWPKLAGIESDRFELPGKEFAAGLARVAHAISTEETRYYLCGVFLHRAEDTADGAPALRATATDGHRLARIDMAWPAGVEPGALAEGVILPRATVAEIRARAEEAETVTIAVTSTMFTLEAGDIALSSKLIDGTFPDYRRVIPRREPAARIRCDGEALIRALRRVEGFAEVTGKAVKSRAVCLANSGGWLALAAGGGGEGDAVDRIEAEIEGEFDSIGLNGIYLRETLSAMAADTAELVFFHRKEPLRLHSVTDDNQVQIIMPLDIAKPAAIAEAEEEDKP